MDESNEECKREPSTREQNCIGINRNQTVPIMRCRCPLLYNIHLIPCIPWLDHWQSVRSKLVPQRILQTVASDSLPRRGQDRHPYLEHQWWSNDDVWKFRPFCLLLLVSSSSMLIHCLGGMIQFYRAVVVHPRKQQGLKQHRSPCNNEDKEPKAQPPAARTTGANAIRMVGKQRLGNGKHSNFNKGQAGARGAYAEERQSWKFDTFNSGE